MSKIAHKVTDAQARRITEALTRPSFELSPETPTVTWRALIKHGLAYHGELRDRVLDERGHLVRSHGVMLTDAGVAEARRIAGDSTITREDVARAAEDALQWIPRNTREEWAARPAHEVLTQEAKRAGQVWRKLARQGGRVPVELQALNHYTDVQNLRDAARRFAQEDGLIGGEQEQGAPVAEEPADVNAPGQQYGGITRADVANGNGPAEALWRAGEFFKMYDAQQAARAQEPTYTIEVTTRVVTGEAESCRYEGENDPEHECTGECTSLDGDVRELEAPRIEEITADADDLEAFEGDPVAWAVDHIRTHTDATEPSSSPIGDTAREREWLSGTRADVYDNSRETQTTVRLTGDWTEQQRAQVFKATTRY